MVLLIEPSVYCGDDLMKPQKKLVTVPLVLSIDPGRLLWGRLNEATKRASDGPIGALDRARAFIVGMKFSLKKLWKYHRIQFFAFFSVQERRRAF